jgi:ABC-type multidrug transport system ATPase subunit
MAELSRGQIYKASLVAAMAADPAIWLLDEPFASGMDPRGMDAFRRLVRDATARGACVIYTSQFPELAVRFADRIVVIDGSKIAADLHTTGVPHADLERSLEVTLGICRESS